MAKLVIEQKGVRDLELPDIGRAPVSPRLRFEYDVPERRQHGENNDDHTRQRTVETAGGVWSPPRPVPFVMEFLSPLTEPTCPSDIVRFKPSAHREQYNCRRDTGQNTRSNGCNRP